MAKYNDIFEVLELISDDLFNITDDMERVHYEILEFADDYSSVHENNFKNYLQAEESQKTAAFEQWLNTSKQICFIQLSLLLGSSNHIYDFDYKKLETALRDYSSFPHITAFGLWAIGYASRIDFPGYSYELQMEAFRLYPALNEIIGVEYKFDDNLLCDSISEICPICGGDKSTDYYNSQQLYIANSPTVAPAKLWKKCECCQNVFAYNFPIKDMDKNNGHYVDSTSEIIEPRYSLRIYSDILNTCSSFTSGDKYLEIGVGNGEMMAAALEMGYNVSAVEINKADAQHISKVLGVDIACMDFLDYKTDKLFDVIIMGDVLEHIISPIEALNKAASLLRKNGVLWISTPNHNSSFARLKKYTDPMLNQVNHFTYFSYEGLAPFIQKAGLTVKHYDISNRYRGSMEIYCVKI